MRLAEKEITGSDDERRVWLFKVATNLIRDRQRKRKTRRGLVFFVAEHSAAASRPDLEAERAEKIALVRKTLAGLDPRARELLLMREEGFTHREIACAIGVATGSVGKLLARARKRFAAKLQNGGYRHDSFF